MRLNAKLLFPAVVLSLALGACDRSVKASNGVVAEKSTGKPIGAAIVAIRWTEIRSTWGGPQEHCLRSETVRTNENGEFRVPPFLRKMNLRDSMMGATPPKVTVTPFSPGYESEGLWSDPVKVTLSRFNGTPQQYAAYLEDLKNRVKCQTGTGDNSLYPFIDAVTSAALSYPPYVKPVTICYNCGTQSAIPPPAAPQEPRDLRRGSDMTAK